MTELTLFYILTAVVGLCVGSFLNVVIYRVPLGMSVVSPPSHCPGCGERIRAYDNIPVLSYLLLRGRCRSCGCRISPRYTLVELLNAALWLLCAVRFLPRGIPAALLAMVACSALVCVCFTDLEHLWIPDRFHVILAAVALAFLALGLRPWQDALIGALIGGGFFYLVRLSCTLLLHREGLGAGDVKLMLVSGLLLGWKGVLLAILAASVSASIILTAVRARQGCQLYG